MIEHLEDPHAWGEGEKNTDADADTRRSIGRSDNERPG